MGGPQADARRETPTVRKSSLRCWSKFVFVCPLSCVPQRVPPQGGSRLQGAAGPGPRASHERKKSGKSGITYLPIQRSYTYSALECKLSHHSRQSRQLAHGSRASLLPGCGTGARLLSFLVGAPPHRHFGVAHGAVQALYGPFALHALRLCLWARSKREPSAVTMRAVLWAC